MNTTNVTYRVREQGDPIRTTFAGFNFETGVPTPIPNDATVEMMGRKVVAQSAEGEDRTKGTEGHRLVLEALKTNPWFEIEGVQVAPKAAPGRPRAPKTPQEYRAYAQEWFTRALTTVALSKRWSDEETLRAKIGMAEDGEDVSFLRPFFEQRMDALRIEEKAK